MSEWERIPCPNRDVYEWVNKRTGERRDSLMGGATVSLGALGGAGYSAKAYQQMENAHGSSGMIAEMMQQYQNPRTVSIPGKKVTMFGSMKKYFDDHRDLLMTLAVLVVVDQWVFDGAFKEKIKALIDRVVGHADQKIKQL